MMRVTVDGRIDFGGFGIIGGSLAQKINIENTWQRREFDGNNLSIISWIVSVIR